MTIRSFLLGLLKRWYIVVAGLIVTVAITGYVYSHTPPEYQRSASVLLMPGTATIPEGGNAFLYLGGLGQASEVLLSTVNSPEVHDPLLRDTPGAQLQAFRDTTSSGPLLSVVATARTDADAKLLVAKMMETIPATLERLQTAAAVPTDARISSLELGRDSRPTLVQKSRVQLTAIVGAAGLVSTILIAGLIDGLLAFRRQRTGEATAAVSTAGERKPEAKGAARVRPQPGASANGMRTESGLGKDSGRASPATSKRGTPKAEVLHEPLVPSPRQPRPVRR